MFTSHLHHKGLPSSTSQALRIHVRFLFVTELLQIVGIVRFPV